MEYIIEIATNTGKEAYPLSLLQKASVMLSDRNYPYVPIYKTTIDPAFVRKDPAILFYMQNILLGILEGNRLTLPNVKTAIERMFSARPDGSGGIVFADESGADSSGGLVPLLPGKGINLPNVLGVAGIIAAAILLSQNKRHGQ